MAKSTKRNGRVSKTQQANNPVKAKATKPAKATAVRRQPAVAVKDAKAPTAKPGRERDPRIPAAGTMLKREYKGKEHAVKVLPDGFEYRGNRYRSLSAIAKEIAQCSWNGLLFFGLGAKATVTRT